MKTQDEKDLFAPPAKSARVMVREAGVIARHCNLVIQNKSPEGKPNSAFRIFRLVAGRAVFVGEAGSGASLLAKVKRLTREVAV